MRYVLMFLAMCSFCFAADAWVDASKSDDSGDGLTKATAKKTIAAAIGVVGDTDTLWAVAGTYAPSQVTLSSAKGFVMRSETGTSTDVVIATTSATWSVQASTAVVAKPHTFQDMTFAPTGSPSQGIMGFNTNEDGSFTFENCILTGGDEEIFTMAPDAAGQLRKVILSNCTITNTNNQIGTVKDCLLLKITGCTITQTNSTGPSFTGAAASDIIDVIVEDSTINIDDVNFLSLDDTDSLSKLRFSGNTVTGGENIVVFADGPTIGQLDISNNISTSSHGGNVYAIGINAQTDADADPANATNIYSGVRIYGNSITKTSTGTAGHPILLGSNVSGADVSYNKCIYAHQTDFGIVIKGFRCTIHHNYVNGGDSIYLNAGGYNIVNNNTCIANGKAALLWNLIDGTSGVGHKVYDNIFDGDGGVRAANDGPTDDEDIFIDNNIYVSGSTGVFELNGSSRDTIATIQSVWTAGYSDLYDAVNDQNSQVLTRSDIAYRDIANHDFSLNPNSKALNVINNKSIGVGATNFGRNTAGAWQPFALPVQEYRSRIAGSPIYR